MDNDALKTWILWVSSDFDILEVHHYLRSGLKVPADHFIHFSTTSTPMNDHALVSRSDSSNDSDNTYQKRWRTIVTVDCWAPNGMTVLASLDTARSDPRVREIFGSETALVGLDTITDLTEFDETYNDPEVRAHFQANFEFHETIEFTKTRTDNTWDDYELTGDLIDDNSVTDDITITGP